MTSKQKYYKIILTTIYTNEYIADDYIEIDYIKYYYNSYDNIEVLMSDIDNSNVDN